mmetsp:Transcript_59665/g.157262  ORF Transcript_59665/g.157262 Transcript_59665/m.157262 type:complete len:427 (-) Transcript_59665:31-1311(-)
MLVDHREAIGQQRLGDVLVAVEEHRGEGALGGGRALRRERALVLGLDDHLLADDELAQRLLGLGRVRLGLTPHARAAERGEGDATLGAGGVGDEQRVARDDLDDAAGELRHVAAVVGRHIVLPQPQPLVLGHALGRAELRRAVGRLRAPVDDAREAHLDELNAHVALRVEHRAQQRAVLVDALKLHAHVAVEEPHLDKVARLARKRLRVLRAVLGAFEAAARDAREHQRDLLEARQQHQPQRRAARHLLDDRVLWRALELLVQRRVVIRAAPLHGTHGGGGLGRVEQTELARLGLRRERDQLLGVGRARLVRCGRLDLGPAVRDDQGRERRAVLKEDGAELAIGGVLTLDDEGHLLADHLLAEELARTPREGLVRRAAAVAEPRRHDPGDGEKLLGRRTLGCVGAHDDDRVAGEDRFHDALKHGHL